MNQRRAVEAVVTIAVIGMAEQGHAASQRMSKTAKRRLGIVLVITALTSAVLRQLL